MIRDMQSRTARRVILGVASIIVAPIAGFRSAAALPNPPGNGPGAGQVVVCVLVPVAVVLLAGLVARVRPAQAALWAFVGLVMTGLAFLFVMWLAFVATGGQ
jgi:hypothetical protein